MQKADFGTLSRVEYNELELDQVAVTPATNTELFF
jgi:hypothetical protein